MEHTEFTENQLNAFPKEAIVALYMKLQGDFRSLGDQNGELLKKVDRLQESLDVLIQQKYGRKTEKNLTDGQLSFDFDHSCILNEAEERTSEGLPEEPSAEEVITYRRKKPVGKREADLKDIVEIDDPASVLPEERLAEEFPGGYTRLEDETYRELHYSPARFEVHVKHIAVYRGRKTNKVIKADRPPRLMPRSIVSPSLAAAVMNAKFVNAVPLNRFAEELKRNDVKISRQVLAGWMIKLSERYFSLLYDRMHGELLKSKLIHCDETPFKVIRDGRGASAKSYMWVYHTHPDYEGRNIYLYDYTPTRATDNPREFLDGYRGILMTDGYQVYHSLERERPEELTVAGCWAHAKRRFANICKTKGLAGAKGTVAQEAVNRIDAIYHVDHMGKNADPDAVHRHRNGSVRPMAEDFFRWIRKVQPDIDPSSETGKAIGYCLNQETFLKAFLNNPIVPLDNNDAERSIRKFCVGRKNWQIIDTPNGAKSSAILYSITETAKANGLKPYYYLKYVMEEMPKYLDGTDRRFIEELLPWSDSLPDYCRNTK